VRVFHDPATANYGAPGHPEAPFRVVESAKRLTAAGIDLERPRTPVSEDDLALVHPDSHAAAVRDGTFSDPDTPAFDNIEPLARVSLSGALESMRSALAGTPALSLMRPPGHHAGKERVSGFCYYNNVAVAALAAVKSGAKRVAILDVDVHHGDGTQSVILGESAVRFCSLHQYPLYPGSGKEPVGNCDNVPLEEGLDGDGYLSRLEPALERLLAFKPDLLAVSAGFDTYKDDPLAGLRLDAKAYRRIGRLLAGTGLPRFAVLEGGYAQDLPLLIEEFLNGFC
jgi:acetoin utilization deacetylase AcuC-like enzyme